MTNFNEFIDYVLVNYINAGVDELDVSKLSTIITAKYGTTTDATNALGDLENIKKVFIDFQQYLYEEHAA